MVFYVFYVNYVELLYILLFGDSCWVRHNAVIGIFVDFQCAFQDFIEKIYTVMCESLLLGTFQFFLFLVQITG